MKPDLSKLTDPQKQAIAAFVRGQASSGQQQIVWAVLAHMTGVAEDPEPGLAERASGFVDGRRWIGITLARIANVPIFSAPPTE